MLAAIADVDVLLKIVGVAFGAGVGITALFGIVLYSTTRLVDLRREGRRALGTAFGVVAVVGFAAFAGTVVIALAIMTDK